MNEAVAVQQSSSDFLHVSETADGLAKPGGQRDIGTEDPDNERHQLEQCQKEEVDDAFALVVILLEGDFPDATKSYGSTEQLHHNDLIKSLKNVSESKLRSER